MRRAEPPAGFTGFSIDGVEVVCAPHVETAFRAMLAGGTLYDWAARQPQARSLAGRGIAYAVTLPGDVERAVVRHNRHGGLLAPLTGDVFLIPTRAPDELEVSETLRARGIPVAPFLGYALYPAGKWRRRVDVVTREIPDSFDLSAALLSVDATARAAALGVTARLVAALSYAQAWHRDLNIKNVLLHRDAAGELQATVLDVDRVFFPTHVPHLKHNLARLRRSALKWRAYHGARVTDAELDQFERDVRSVPRPSQTAW